MREWQRANLLRLLAAKVDNRQAGFLGMPSIEQSNWRTLLAGFGVAGLMLAAVTTAFAVASAIIAFGVWPQQDTGSAPNGALTLDPPLQPGHRRAERAERSVVLRAAAQRGGPAVAAGSAAAAAVRPSAARRAASSTRRGATASIVGRASTVGPGGAGSASDAFTLPSPTSAPAARRESPLGQVGAALEKTTGSTGRSLESVSDGLAAAVQSVSPQLAATLQPLGHGLAHAVETLGAALGAALGHKHPSVPSSVTERPGRPR
jgi:hypothetical protein